MAPYSTNASPTPPTESALLAAAWTVLHDPASPKRYPSTIRLALAVLAPLAQAGWPRKKAIAYLAKGGPGVQPIADLEDARRARLYAAAWRIVETTVLAERDLLVEAIAAARWRLAVAPSPGRMGETDRLVQLSILSTAIAWRSATVLASSDAVATETGLGLRTVRRALARIPAATNHRKSLVKFVSWRPGHPRRFRVYPAANATGRGAQGQPDPAAPAENAPAHSPSRRKLVKGRPPAGSPPDLGAWLCDHLGHDAFARRAAGPIGHHLCCLLVEGEATTVALAERCGHDRESVRHVLFTLAAAGVVIREHARAPWRLCAERIAERKAQVASHARRLSDERAAGKAIEALEAGAPWPWELRGADRRQGAEALVGRVVEAAGEALEAAGRAKRAGEWNAEDVAFAAGVVVECLGWPEGWEKTRD